ncbi:hypothetical protein PRIC1_012683 [Phytophthora ramorum]
MCPRSQFLFCFVPTKMDEATTLSEVLTMLDAIDSSESDASSSTSLESEISFKAVSNVSPPQQAQLKTPKTKKDRRRKEGPVRYTTSLQRRKKTELKCLREESQQLNAQLEQLRLSRLRHLGMLPTLTAPTHNSGPSTWRSLVMIESEGRERAERINRELKLIMAKQLSVCASIRKVLGRSNVLEGMNFVFDFQPTCDRPLSQLDFSDAILAELSNSLGQLRLEVDTVFPALKGDISITCTTRNKCHEVCGNRVETTSITPMACAMQQAAQILWRHITTKQNKDTQKSFRFVRTRNPNSLERNCMASLPDGKGALLSLDGVNIVSKYDEENRIVLVGTTTWFLPTGGLQFEDHHWTTISPSPVDPLHASVVRSCYQLQVKRVDTASVLPLDFAHVEGVVLNSIGRKLRNVLQLQQNVLLESIYPDAGTGQETV